MLLVLTLSGCASLQDKIPPPATAQPKAPVAAPTAKQTATPAPAKVPASRPVSTPAPVILSEAQINELVLKLLPPPLKNKQGWASDLQSAFKALQVPSNPENYCAAIAIIEQESSFQADPVVPGLPAIVKHEIEQRRDKYGIPQTVINWMLSTASSDGRSYQLRIDELKTEKELSDLIEEIVTSIPAGKKLFTNYNPIRTGGPMQVSVEFAEAHARVRPYPYPIHDSLRNEVFSRRGGLYFGTAILLDYPAPYDEIIYRFADFNAGRYSSRNAAFQQAVSRLNGRSLATDGDLLRYEHGQPSASVSNTQHALNSIGSSLKMGINEIQRDLLLEKYSTFTQTPLYSRVFALADKGGVQPRVIMPDIDLHSPKFQRKLTTAWFANRVNKRFQSCLKRGGITGVKPIRHATPSTRR